MIYCYSCPKCGYGFEVKNRDVRTCPACMKADLVRDYRAENVGVSLVEVKKLREHPQEEYAAKMLPTNADFASPSDPEGKKGMRQWRDEHRPKEGNKRPFWPGEVEKKTF